MKIRWRLALHPCYCLDNFVAASWLRDCCFSTLVVILAGAESSLASDIDTTTYATLTLSYTTSPDESCRLACVAFLVPSSLAGV